MPGFAIHGSDGPPHTVETNRDHRWEIWIGDIDRDVCMLALNCTRPIYVTDPVTIHNRQNEIYLPGKTRWEPVKIELYSDQKKTISEIEKWRNLSIEVQGGSGGLESIKNKAWDTAHKTLVTINLLDGLGDIKTTYYLHGAWPSRIEGSNWDYASTNISTVTMTITYDSAVIEGQT